MIPIEESKHLDAIKIEGLIGSLQTYELSLPSFRKEKSIALNTIRKAESDSCDDEKLKDGDLAYLTRKFKNFLKNKNRYFERNKSESSISSKEKSEKSNLEIH